jgi:hypothetical protein
MAFPNYVYEVYPIMGSTLCQNKKAALFKVTPTKSLSKKTKEENKPEEK